MWSRFRLIAAGVFMAGVAVVYGHDLVRDADYHWPVSIYPMYSDLRRSDLPLTLFQLYGVSGDGREVPIADVPPMDRSRLTAALAGMSPDARLAAMAAVARGEHLAALRLYREDWRAGGDSLLGRMLLVDTRER